MPVGITGHRQMIGTEPVRTKSVDWVVLLQVLRQEVGRDVGNQVGRCRRTNLVRDNAQVVAFAS